MSAEQRAIKDACFGTLRYSTMWAFGENSCNLRFFDQLLSKDFMAKSKDTQTVRWEESQAAHGDLSYWRTADTSKIYSEAILSEFIVSDVRSKEDKLSKHEAGRRAYLVFIKFDVCRSTESCTFFIPELDCIIACIVYGIQDQSKGSRTRKPSQSVIPTEEDFDYSYFPAVAEKKCRQRGLRKPLDKIGSIYGYMQAAVGQFLHFCCDENFYEGSSRGRDQDDVRFVCTDRKMGEPLIRFGNCFENLLCRLITAFSYPGIGGIDIFLKFVHSLTLFLTWWPLWVTLTFYMYAQH